MRRRDFLTGSMLAATGLPRSGRAVSGLACMAGSLPDLESMADEILRTSRKDVTPLALGWVKRGASFRDLLGAAYLAGLREINPSPIGGQVHALMMVPSAAETAVALRGKDKLLPALFHLDRVKRSQARDASARRGDWVMPDAPAVDARPTAELVTEFTAAMQKWSEKDADRAVVALHDALPLNDFFELLWPWAARDFRIIGHKMIFATQTYRALTDLGWRYGRDAVRSVMLGILDQNPYGRFSNAESKHILGVHENNVARARRFPAGWRSGRVRPDASFELLRRLRESDADGCAEAVLAALKDGVDATTAWDGVRLHAFEILMRRPSIAGVHTVTSVNAMYRASLYTTRESTRRLTLLQAASWMPMFGPILEGRADIPNHDRRIDVVAAKEADGDPFATADFGDAAPRAARMARKAGRRFRARAIRTLARKAHHDHDYKFTVAALEEIDAAHPAVRPSLAAASMAFLRNDRSSDGSVYRAVRSQLIK